MTIRKMCGYGIYIVMILSIAYCWPGLKVFAVIITGSVIIAALFILADYMIDSTPKK